MQKIKIIVRNYEKKSGGKFTKLTIGGKYINDVLADEAQTYQVRFTSKSVVKAPTQDGIYEVAFNDGEAWIDSRPEHAEKFIYRITAQRVKFNKPLPRLEKDIREVKSKEAQDDNLPF